MISISVYLYFVGVRTEQEVQSRQREVVRVRKEVEDFKLDYDDKLRRVRKQLFRVTIDTDANTVAIIPPAARPRAPASSTALCQTSVSPNQMSGGAGAMGAASGGTAVSGATVTPSSPGGGSGQPDTLQPQRVGQLERMVNRLLLELKQVGREILPPSA